MACGDRYLDGDADLLAELTDDAEALLVVGPRTAHPDGHLVLTQLLLEGTQRRDDTCTTTHRVEPSTFDSIGWKYDGCKGGACVPLKVAATSVKLAMPPPTMSTLPRGSLKRVMSLRIVRA